MVIVVLWDMMTVVLPGPADSERDERDNFKLLREMRTKGGNQCFLSFSQLLFCAKEYLFASILFLLTMLPTQSLSHTIFFFRCEAPLIYSGVSIVYGFV